MGIYCTKRHMCTQTVCRPVDLNNSSMTRTLRRLAGAWTGLAPGPLPFRGQEFVSADISTLSLVS